MIKEKPLPRFIELKEIEMKKDNILLLVLLLFLALLRFVNLGYSEYIPDEGTVMTSLKDTGTYTKEFFLTQRKGPMQFLVAGGVHFLSGDVFNELIFRIPFAISSVLAILFFYLFLKNATNNQVVSIVSSILFGINGFIVAFGRVVQYQSLNMMFSFISLYFFSSKRFVWGTLFFCLSLLSHWDAVFILPIIIYLVFKNFNLKQVLYSFIIGCIVLLPFLMPYTSNYLKNTDNQEYVASRFGGYSIESKEKIKDYKNSIELYNPFIFLEVIGVLLLFSLFSIKKSWLYFIWFGIIFFIFWFFVTKPGTHIYNIFIPVSILCGFGFSVLYDIFPKCSKVLPLLIITFILGFLYYQSYILFVDHIVSYPWEQKQVWKYTTKEYSSATLPNNLIGFPLYNGWEEINKFLLSHDGTLKYITNENKSMSNFYMDLEYSEKQKRPYYAVGIKNPLSFVTDYKFSQIQNKTTIYKVDGVNGNTFARLYLVEKEDE